MFDAGPPVDGSTTTLPDAGPRCGDTILQAGESCDDGNTTDGDGCSATCSWEARCGDGTLQTGEVCDDGNNRSGDGCRANCMSDESCGNNILDVAAGEQCDDGNTVDGDTCAADCSVVLTCGDGTTDANEQCDDGNTTSWDGCSASCREEISLLIDSLMLADAATGCDFSGDGAPDNLFGASFGPILELAGGGNLADNITVLLNFIGLDDLAGVDDPDVSLGWLSAMTTGTPGEYTVDPGALNADGTPMITFDGSIASMLLAAGPEDIALPVLFLPVEISQARMTGTTAATAGRVSSLSDGLLCGGINLGVFSAFPVPMDTPFVGMLPACSGTARPTFADLIVGGAFIIPPTQPDIDLDGDGLEYYEVTGGSMCQPVITACVDGDGTRIDGRSCATDPRMADGLSSAFNFSAIAATVVP